MNYEMSRMQHWLPREVAYQVLHYEGTRGLSIREFQKPMTDADRYHYQRTHRYGNLIKSLKRDSDMLECRGGVTRDACKKNLHN